MAMSRLTGLLIVCVLGLSVACIGLLVALLVRSEANQSYAGVTSSSKEPGSPIISGSIDEDYSDTNDILEGNSEFNTIEKWQL